MRASSLQDTPDRIFFQFLDVACLDETHQRTLDLNGLRLLSRRVKNVPKRGRLWQGFLNLQKPPSPYSTTPSVPTRSGAILDFIGAWDGTGQNPVGPV